MGCHYFLITGQVSPCHYNKLRQTVAQKKKKKLNHLTVICITCLPDQKYYKVKVQTAIMLANLTPACLENLLFSRYCLMEHI